MTTILKRIVYSPPKSDYASHVQNLPEITLRPKTSSAMPSSFTDHISMPSMPSMSMPHISMPTISASSISLPKLSLPSFPKLTFPYLKDDLTSSAVLPILLILLILSLIAYILHTYLITPHESPRHVAFDQPTGPAELELRTAQVYERCLAQARRDYALERLSARPTPLQHGRADQAAWGRVVAPPLFEPQTVAYAPAREPGVPARAPTPFTPPVLPESPEPMTPVRENHNNVLPVRRESPVSVAPVQENLVRTPSPAPSSGLVARLVAVVSLRRSTRVRRAPKRFDEMDFPKGRRT